jgi:uncharacterized protein YndB with AHSA1/START domain
MSDVTATVEVAVPIEIAYNQWTQFESFPRFMSGVKSVRQLDDRHTHWVTQVAGAHREFDAEITEQRPDERIAWRSLDGDLRHAGAVTFRPITPRETQVTVQLSWEPQGTLEKAGSLLGLDERQVKADAERFKEFIEQRGAETGQWRGTIPAPPDGVRPEDRTRQATGQEPETAREATRPDDVVDVLLSQHEYVKRLLAQVEGATGPEKAALLSRLASLLDLHETAERRFVHPMTHAAGDEQVAEARIAEETGAGLAIADLKRMGVDDPGFGAAFADFHRAVLEHATREETQEFPRLRQKVPAQRLLDMATELIAMQNAMQNANVQDTARVNAVLVGGPLAGRTAHVPDISEPVVFEDDNGVLQEYRPDGSTAFAHGHDTHLPVFRHFAPAR